MYRNYKDRFMQRVYDTARLMATNGDFLQPDGSPRRTTPLAAAFWDGYNGLKRSANAVPGTPSYACYVAGKDHRAQTIS